jgi:RNA methyltransferase, TrmH family
MLESLGLLSRNLLITSTQNSKIKWVRALQNDAKARREAKAFVVEGVRLVEEALASGWEIQWMIYSDDLSGRGRALVEKFSQRGGALDSVTSQVMGAVSDTQNDQGILAVVEIRQPVLPAELDFVFIADSIRDPGNLGTMIRTAAAAGVPVLLLSTGTVDPFAPKVVRSAMGGHFRLPILVTGWDEIEALVRRYGLAVYLADRMGGIPYTQADFLEPLALVVGGEAEGASPAANSLAKARVAIRMPGGGESLNAAVASGILLFEIIRQRTGQLA